MENKRKVALVVVDSNTSPAKKFTLTYGHDSIQELIVSSEYAKVAFYQNNIHSNNVKFTLMKYYADQEEELLEEFQPIPEEWVENRVKEWIKDRQNGRKKSFDNLSYIK